MKVQELDQTPQGAEEDCQKKAKKPSKAWEKKKPKSRLQKNQDPCVPSKKK